METLNKWIMAGVLIAGLSGCALFNKVDLEYHRTTTIGQELIDLQKAKDKGVISDEEYFNAKKEILAGGPLVCTEKKK